MDEGITRGVYEGRARIFSHIPAEDQLAGGVRGGRLITASNGELREQVGARESPSEAPPYPKSGGWCEPSLWRGGVVGAGFRGSIAILDRWLGPQWRTEYLSTVESQG